MTIQKEEESLLGFPNREVETSLDHALLPSLGVENAPRERRMLFRHLNQHDLGGLEAHLKALHAGLPHDWYRNDLNNQPIAKYEGHYASVFCSHFVALELGVAVGDASHHSRVDMSVDIGGLIYLFEFKVVEQLPEGRALEQIKHKGYADKHHASGKPIHLVGVEFSSAERQIVAFEVETLA